MTCNNYNENMVVNQPVLTEAVSDSLRSKISLNTKIPLTSALRNTVDTSSASNPTLNWKTTGHVVNLAARMTNKYKIVCSARGIDYSELGYDFGTKVEYQTGQVKLLMDCNVCPLSPGLLSCQNIEDFLEQTLQLDNETFKSSQNPLRF